MLEPESAGLPEPLPGRDPELGRGSRYASESRDHLMKDVPRPGGLRHPYAEPDDHPGQSIWRAFEPPGQPDTGTADDGPANPGPPDPATAALPTAARSSEPPTATSSESAATDPEPAAATPDPAPAPQEVAPARPETPVPPTEPRKRASSPGQPAARARSQRRPTPLGPAGRAPAGSLADLRSRLDRLPDGHPSSPYEDGGHARPLPILLKHLELGLPAPGRELGGGSVAEAEPDDDQFDPAQERATSYARTEDGRAAHSSAAPGEASDLTLGPWPGLPPARTSDTEEVRPQAGNGHAPSKGHGNGSRQRTTSQLGSRGPDRVPDNADRSATAPQLIAETLPADLRELVERTLATCRTAEGRNVLGGYGSSGLTPAMQRLAASLPFGGLAPDSETNSLKSPDRFTAKLARLIARNPDRTAEELATTIGDVVRYAFAFEAADYVEGTWLVHRRLKSHGFELEIRRNRWESPEHKGIFTQWRDPAHRVAFEVQFHTLASWAVVQRTHDSYAQITDPATPPAERARLRARQVAAAAVAKAPPNWAELDDFRLEAR